MDISITAIEKKISTYALDIIEKIGPSVEYKFYPKGHRILLSSARPNTLYMIRSGVISVHRQPDDILIAILKAPTLRGMMNAHLWNFSSDTAYTLKVIEGVEMATISRDEFSLLLNELQLWDVYAKHLEFNLSMLSEHLFKLLSPTAYDVVRLQLPELMSEPESVRNSVTIEEYIRSKTRISRSRIMKILSELKAAGYIQINRGNLVWIKELPDKALSK
jgi:CRP-like cAMP-binding protein